MIFDVTHITQFSYSKPVFLEPHSVRLRPRHDSSQRLLDFDMRVEPAPAGLSPCIDLDGNETTRIWFDGLQEIFKITTAFRVETLCTSPFDFVLEPAALVLPVAYTGELTAALAPYLHRATPSPHVDRFAQGIAQEVDNKTLPFVIALTRRIQEMCEFTLRPVGDPWPASVTLTRQQGTCRDFAVLLMDACRAAGLATRFVSGYQEGDPTRTERELHAWVEVYLPGAGWRGYDPTYGVPVSDQHVAVAAGLTPGAAAPTLGTFRGTGTDSTLWTEIRMRVTNSETSTKPR